MVVSPEIVNRGNQYVGLYSELVEVSRLVINWPSLTEATLASRQKDSCFERLIKHKLNFNYVSRKTH